MEIIKAIIKDTDEILNLIRSSSIKMYQEGIDQWDEIYPNKEIILNDIKNKELYVYKENAIILGIIVLNTFQDEEYKEIDWKYKDKTPLVIHRLCIHPNSQGKGLAKKLLSFAENYAINNNYQTIRLDCFTKNKTATNLYIKNGYIIRGKVNFRKGQFYCLEKLL